MVVEITISSTSVEELSVPPSVDKSIKVKPLFGVVADPSKIPEVLTIV